MKVIIIGAGNMGGSIALALASANSVLTECISVIDTQEDKVALLIQKNPTIKGSTSQFQWIQDADMVIIAVKPWLVEEVLNKHKTRLHAKQILVSIAAGITLDQLELWTPKGTSLFRAMPNTAVAVKQSITFVSSKQASDEDVSNTVSLFKHLGKVELIEEKLFPAATALASCGIAFAFRYIRAAMQGGVEIGFHPQQAQASVIQTLRGAIELLEANQSHPEVEIDKVTTAGGITIQGLNAMEDAGFTSAVIQGLKASNKPNK